MKFTKIVKSAKIDGRRINFDSLQGSIMIDILNDNFVRLGLWSGGYNGDTYHKEGEDNYDELVEVVKQLYPELEQICTEFDNKIMNLMKQHGFNKEKTF